MTTPPKPIEDTQAIPADIMEAAEAVYRDELSNPVEAIAKAILSERQRNEWQPIETAPKDGTEIILFCPQGDGTPGSTFRLTSGSWFIPPVLGYIGDPDVDDDEPPSWLSWDGGFSDGTMMPTHWMPLPEPPKTDNPNGNNRFSRKGE